MRNTPIWWCVVGCAATETTAGPPPSAPDAEVAPLVVYVVRHAEKGTDPPDDPLLTDAGRARALALAATLADVELRGVASTDTARTRSTAGPTAGNHRLEVQLYDAIPPIAQSVREARGAWLIVGHSNTVPALVAALAEVPVGSDLDGGEYDRLTQIVELPGADPVVQVLRYGGPSAPR